MGTMHHGAMKTGVGHTDGCHDISGLLEMLRNVGSRVDIPLAQTQDSESISSREQLYYFHL